jgi:hypothetical protein
VLRGKCLANKYKCFVERSRFSQKYIGFAINRKFSQEERNFLPRIDIGFAKRENFIQERI